MILFADDDITVREGLAELLRRSGFEVMGVGSAAEALDRLKAAEFDALISDIHMPGNSELELIADVPQIAAGLPVILLTGRPSVDTAARSVRLSVTAYLTKPPDLAELSRILDQAIADYRGFRAMRSGRARLQEWESEIDRIEQMLRKAPLAQAGGPMGSYLRLTLRQVILMLSDLEQATGVLEQPTPTVAGTTTLTRIDHAAALRHTVDVLERTKQNFKSKDLADLRKQLEALLTRTPA
ncbi:MAG TPA: response regulator [Lacunisphaera sp.]|jgi:CheY-like chemotaxis protein